MEWLANKAQQHFHATGQIMVIVQDNASVHRSQWAQQHISRWRDQGLFLFFLPPYSPQMNRIEDEWLHLKHDELASRVFEDEYEKRDTPRASALCAIAIIDGIENRAIQGQYQVERFTFN